MDLIDAIDRHLEILVERIGPRPPGSPANHRANDYLVDTLRGAGLDVTAVPFTTTWWRPGAARLEIAGESVALDPPPFSRPCDVSGPVRRFADRPALARAEDLSGSVLVLHGQLTTEPIFPKAFPFLELPEQRAFVDDLERLRPAAVVAVVERAGPYAFFEDPDLAFPYAIVGPDLGRSLGEGSVVRLSVGGELLEGPGVNVAARTPGSRGARRRIVVSAHVDSKVTTPGAFDNAGGVATLLALAGSRRIHDRPVELVFFNGEDHYSAPGEQAWLASTDLEKVAGTVNLDGAGVTGRDTAVAALACPPELEARARRLVTGRSGWTMAEAWYESDHAIFAMRGIPSLAITTAGVHDLLADLAHTERDTRDVVDPAVLAGAGEFLVDWLEAEPAVG